MLRKGDGANFGGLRTIFNPTPHTLWDNHMDTHEQVEALKAQLIPIGSQVGDHVKNKVQDAFEFLLFFYNNLFLQCNFVVAGVLVLQLGLFHLLLHELEFGALVLHELNQKVHMVSLYHFSFREEFTDVGDF